MLLLFLAASISDLQTAMLRLWLLSALLSGEINIEVARKYYGVRVHLDFLV